MKILVTGGSGFIGSALCHGLVRAGHALRVLDDDSRGNRHRLIDLDGHYEFISGDIRDMSSVRRAVAGMDCVCHLAAVNGTEFFYSKPKLVLEVAVKGMLNVLDACFTEGVDQLVTASSSEVYQKADQIPTPEGVPLLVPDPLNPRYSYGGGKIISELLTLNYGREFFKRAMIFRPHNVYGPDMGMEHVIPQVVMRMVKNFHESGESDNFDFTIQGDGTETRSFLYIDDMVSGILSLLEKGEHLNIYHIGNRTETSIHDLVQMIAHELHYSINLVSGPLQKGSVLRRCPNIEKITELGFEPKFTLAEGLRKTIPWYKAVVENNNK